MMRFKGALITGVLVIIMISPIPNILVIIVQVCFHVLRVGGCVVTINTFVRVRLVVVLNVQLELILRVRLVVTPLAHHLKVLMHPFLMHVEVAFQPRGKLALITQVDLLALGRQLRVTGLHVLDEPALKGRLVVTHLTHQTMALMLGSYVLSQHELVVERFGTLITVVSDMHVFGFFVISQTVGPFRHIITFVT